VLEKRHIRALGLALYFAMYVVARDWHIVVHAVSWSEGHHGKEIVEHSVEPGDPGIPLLNPVHASLVLISGPLFGPVRAVEERLWKIAQPAGTPIIEAPPKSRPPMDTPEQDSGAPGAP
jgi:hypothetical protein